MLCGLLFTAQADVILKDLFDDGTLATFSATGGQVNGGFDIIGSGGAAIEDGVENKVRISNAPSGSQYGILSSGTVSLGGAPRLRTTWEITDSSLKNNAESLVFTWQLSTNLATSPVIALVLDVQNNEVYLMTSGNTNQNVEIDVSFGATNDVFSVVTEFSLESYNVEGSGALEERNVNIPIAFGLPWSSGAPDLDNFHVGVYVNGKSSNGLVVEIDSVTVETIPEPAVISLISLFGGGMLISKRVFSGKPSD